MLSPSIATRGFPAEAIAAARAERLMGVAVPRELGGEGAGIADVVDVCYVLGRACASTAMVYAMHQTKVACLVRHGSGSAWHRLLLRRIVQRTDAARLLDDRGSERRRRAQQRGADRARRIRALRSSGRQPSSPTARRPTASSPRRGAPPMRRAPIRSSSYSSSRTMRSSGSAAGTRSACAAPAAAASSSSPRARASRSCP